MIERARNKNYNKQPNEPLQSTITLLMMIITITKPSTEKDINISACGRVICIIWSQVCAVLSILIVLILLAQIRSQQRGEANMVLIRATEAKRETPTVWLAVIQSVASRTTSECGLVDSILTCAFPDEDKMQVYCRLRVHTRYIRRLKTQRWLKVSLSITQQLLNLLIGQRSCLVGGWNKGQNQLEEVNSPKESLTSSFHYVCWVVFVRDLAPLKWRSPHALLSLLIYQQNVLRTSL